MDTQRAAMMAIDLMAYHGLMKDDPLGYNNSWNFEFNRRVTAVGVCSYRKRTIFLSRPLTEINSEDEILDTILHEIAHALAPQDSGHGRLWKLTAQSLGARPERCASATTIVQVPQRFMGTCLDCNVQIPRSRRPKPSVMYHGLHDKCRHKANRGGIRWTDNGAEIGRSF